ncbi:MAG TPA: NADH-quinone oxidoreductase subunit N [Candidatus Acidoferrales bacterium]|nr:NADH-quinone oxidoreductase subunit N [Candidatus Acidoferrales bacterium]
MHLSPDQMANFARLFPEAVLCAFGLLIMVVDPFVGPARQRVLGWIGFVGALAALAAVYVPARHMGMAYSDLISTDAFSVFVHVVVIAAAAIAILGSIDYLDQQGIQRGEYYALVLFATAGMGILAGANELVTAFVGLEMSSIASYVLAGFRRRAKPSNEASMKYFLLGSFATAFFLYGIAMTYGATGSTRIDHIQAFLDGLASAGHSLPALAILGIGLMFVGLGFKVVAAPFQIYAPDVYEGAPTPVTALLASAPKAATFAVMLRIFFIAFGAAGGTWFWMIWISAVLTMFVGNLAALVQTNVKRMLAYSSIAHAGYILVAFAASTDLGIAAVLFYLAAYVFMKVGAFLVLAHLGQQDEQHLSIRDYAGLGQQQPVLAVCFSLFLLSLLGLPATGGFLGKFFAFQAALDSHSGSALGSAVVWLVVVAAINSVIGAYYYLRVIVAMYFWEPSREYTPTRVAPALTVALFLAAAGTLYLGLFPGQILALAKTAADSLPLH